MQQNSGRCGSQFDEAPEGAANSKRLLVQLPNSSKANSPEVTRSTNLARTSRLYDKVKKKPDHTQNGGEVGRVDQQSIKPCQLLWLGRLKAWVGRGLETGGSMAKVAKVDFSPVSSRRDELADLPGYPR
jgi:hypothetical protein